MAGPGQDSSGDAREEFAVGALVLDPEIPERGRLELARTPPSSLIPFNTKTADIPKTVPQQVAADGESGIERRVSFALGAAVTAPLLAAFFGMLALAASGPQASGCSGTYTPGVSVVCWGPYTAPDSFDIAFSRVCGKLAFAALIVFALAVAVWFEEMDRLRSARHATELRSFSAGDAGNADTTRPVNIYHGRYVMPLSDLDDECRPLWERTVAAWNRIFRTDVFTGDVIDSEQLKVASPYYLWGIARTLAELSAVRAQHDEILGCNDPADPGLAGVLTSQQAAQARVITDTESRVRSLEAFADRAEEADSVLSREKTARKIADLNDSYLDLLAQSSDRDFLDMTIGMTEELAVVIEQAKAAIREVTEAARLTLPVPRTPQDNH